MPCHLLLFGCSPKSRRLCPVGDAPTQRTEPRRSLCRTTATDVALHLRTQFTTQIRVNGREDLLLPRFGARCRLLPQCIQQVLLTRARSESLLLRLRTILGNVLERLRQLRTIVKRHLTSCRPNKPLLALGL
jgi:hypothetical protein